MWPIAHDEGDVNVDWHIDVLDLLCRFDFDEELAVAVYGKIGTPLSEALDVARLADCQYAVDWLRIDAREGVQMRVERVHGPILGTL
jgi:hypothetical protein